MANNKTVYIRDGSIYNAVTDTFINRPAIMFDPDNDMLLAYGEYDGVCRRFDKYIEAAPDMCTEYVLFHLFESSLLTTEMQCYILKRAIEYTASGFIRNLNSHLGTGDLSDWIASEMARVPLDLT